MSDDNLIARLEGRFANYIAYVLPVVAKENEDLAQAFLLGIREAQGWLAALRLAAERGAEGWQPIATAPKDGRVVLLSRHWYDGPHVEACWWMRDQQQWAGLFAGCDTAATHWRPLPPPPASSSGESEG